MQHTQCVAGPTSASAQPGGEPQPMRCLPACSHSTRKHAVKCMQHVCLTERWEEECSRLVPGKQVCNTTLTTDMNCMQIVVGSAYSFLDSVLQHVHAFRDRYL
mmetsp:Transcript_13845/g.24254  ORF Transcript_13845/g.24254 Transcript_13845/m.24254 type:complete len:103 (+) Transcript_13845:380-688(+)